MSATDARAVADFLSAFAPFDALDRASLERVAVEVELETIPAATTIFAPGEDPVRDLRVIRSGAVEIVGDGRVLDLLGEGELFGHASLLSGLPAGFEARTAEDTACYRIPADVAESVLSAPAGLRYVARSLIEQPTELHSLARQPARNLADQPVGMLLSGEPVVCGPQTEVRRAAELMSLAHVSSVVVDIPGGGLGIMTERDLATRVVAGGLSADAPVSAAMSAPAYSCGPERPAGEVLLDMLDRGIRHCPVVSATGVVLGVIEYADLLVARTRTSFYLRQRVAQVRSVSELAVVAAELRPMFLSLHEARVAAANVMAVYSATVDAITRRMLELELERGGPPPVPFAWLALGSQGRREALPSSDVDSAIVWFGEQDDGSAHSRLLELGRRVTDGLERCGLRADEHGASASAPAFVRALGSWQAAIKSWIEDPSQPKALVLTSALMDSRPVWGLHTGTPVADTFRLAPRSSALVSLLARFALSHRPPTGFFRGLVVEHSGEHRGRLDLKHGGVVPIADLARWAGIAAGVTSASTVERLRQAGFAETLPPADASTLRDAFTLVSELRAQGQAEHLQAGLQPEDHIEPAALSPLMRNQLKEAFRAIASVQRRLGTEITLGAK